MYSSIKKAVSFKIIQTTLPFVMAIDSIKFGNKMSCFSTIKIAIKNYTSANMLTNFTNEMGQKSSYDCTRYSKFGMNQ